MKVTIVKELMTGDVSPVAMFSYPQTLLMMNKSTHDERKKEKECSNDEYFFFFLSSKSADDDEYGNADEEAGTSCLPGWMARYFQAA